MRVPPSTCPTTPPPLLLLIALAGAASAACGEPFPPGNRIQELRVLAIKSEPVAPAPGESTTLSALVFTPMPDPTVTYAWSWCPLAGPANDGYPCLIDEAELTGMAGGAGVMVPPYNLGTGATAQLPHTIDPQILQQLCAARGAMVQGGRPLGVDCEGGFPVQIKVTVRTATDEVTAIRRLRLRLAAGGEPSNNPRFQGLSLVMKPGPGEQLVPLMDGDDPQVSLARAPETHELKVSIGMESAEPYTGKDDNLQPKAMLEKLTFAWFVESGSTEENETNFVDMLSTLDRATRNEWEPGRTKDYPRDTARVIVLVKDNRDGVDWGAANVRLVEAP